MELLQKSKYDELEKKYDLNIQKKEQLKTALEALKSKRSDLEEVLRNTFQKVDQLNAEVSSLHIENQQRQTAVVKVFTELDDFVCQKKKELQIITKKLSTEKDDTSAVNSSLPVIREEDFQKLPKLTCDLCGQQYQTKREMIFHMKSFHTRRRFKCNICFETFAFQQNCYAHIKNKHARLRDFKRFVRRISRKKKKGNRKNSGKLTCYLCGKQYKTKQGLSYHVESAHVRIKYKCQICSSTFVNQVYCFAHVKKIHWKWKDFRSFVKVVSQKNEVLETISKVENRMRTPIKPIAKVNNGYDQEHLLDFSDHPCNLCRKKYKSKQGLTIHKENFHAKIKFKCKICFKMFGYKQTCTSHIKIGHSKFTDYKRFIQAVSQEKKKFGIIETISENEEKETITTKPIDEVNPEGNLQDSGMPTCDLCGKQYLSKQGLAFHVENLHERRKFKCGICSKIFSYQQCCITHVKNEHSKSGDYRLFVNAFTDTEQKKQILSTALFK
ncbi:zinc finger protein 761-like isoform X2 [Belonocnema kinseyi]|nr:zinc finger protein 761-like isoform X2 [Belonocnema kinseyi]